MSKAIATVSSVFAACDRLEAANERWNRDDVRAAIGGGGFVVIDPLIRAWRELKPLREVAPSAPAELLHQIATSLEVHLAGFVESAESRVGEAQQVFENTVEELSSQLATLERDLNERTNGLASAETDNARLIEEVEGLKAELASVKTEASQQADTIDTLRGRIAREEKDHATALKGVQAEQRELAKERDNERARTAKEHAETLEKQRKELIAAAEQAENRLMGLLDQERQGAKALEAALSKEIVEKNSALQAARESVIDFKAQVKALEKQTMSLEKDLANKSKQVATLLQQLDSAKQASTDIGREYQDYKTTYQISSELGSLKEVVAGLQAQLKTPKAAARKRSKKPVS